MRLPHRDPIRLGPTPYEAFQEREGIPSVTGFFIEDLMDVEVKPWARMGVLGSFLNLGEQQETEQQDHAAGRARSLRARIDALIRIVRRDRAEVRLGVGQVRGISLGHGGLRSGG